jgi:transcription elongation factor GreA
MTAEGKIQVLEELTRLKAVDRPRIVQEIGTARGHGDLSENAEYHAAKERQGQLEARIRFLEDQVARAEVIDRSQIDTRHVMFGTTVKLFDVNTEQEIQYRIVGELEADLQKNYISINSPIAKALIGKEVGDVALVQVPGGKRELEVVQITLE